MDVGRNRRRSRSRKENVPGAMHRVFGYLCVLFQGLGVVVFFLELCGISLYV